MSSPAITTTHCALCGLPPGPAIFKGTFDGVDKVFCCHGCLHVFTILRESGALLPGVDPRDTDLFRRSLEAGLVSQPEVAAESDGPVGDTLELALQVDGMWCASCAWLIEHMLRRERGVITAEVLFTSDLAESALPAAAIPPARIRERIERLGYRVSEYKPGAERADDGRRRDLLLRLGVAGFVWVNVMTLSSVFYVSYFEAIADSMRTYLPFVMMALAAPAVFYSAWPVLRLADWVAGRDAPDGGAAGAWNFGRLWIQRLAGGRRREPLLFRYGVRHCDVCSDRQGAGSRSEGTGGPGVDAAASDDASESAASGAGSGNVG